jgi:tetratricopeptide (TPR) repeat protein
MAQRRSGPSMAELIQRHARTRFVGRGGELASFRANFDIPHDDPGHRFLFHLHGSAGVGKTYLVREMRRAAEERGALTAYLDESVGSVPEALASISEQFARKGHPLARLDRMLATYRERRHEAVLASLPGDVHPPAGPSAGGRAVAVASLVGLGAVPGLGALTGVIDAGQLAGAADQVWASLSSRFRNPDDVRLVLAPEQALTPVLTRELADVAAEVPWIALFFDTYERTAPFLDTWLRDLMTTEEYGGLTPRAVVTVAGQRPFDSACWGGRPYFMADVRLEPFTEGEARELLAAKQVTDEGVVTEILRLSRGLPVLVSTLAENQPADPGDVGDPSASAVERFLKWERDPVRRAAALACALPRRLNEDIFLAVVGEEAAGLYGWLCDLPFAAPKDGGIGYHDVVRVPMLRLRRTRSPHRWREQHAALARTFASWRAETEDGVRPDKLWENAAWRALRLEETYHELCASPRAALPGALATVVDACREGGTAARRCARALAEAGEDTDDREVRDWGLRLRAALSGADANGDAGADAGGGEGGGIRAALGLLIDGAGLDTAGRAAAHEVRGRELYNARENEAALAEYDRSLALDPGGYLAYAGRGVNHVELYDYAAAVADLRRADELAPGTPWVLGWYAEALRRSGRVEEAVGVLDRALALDPANAFLLACRGVCRHLLGSYTEALADFDRALELDGDYLWALVRRGRLLRATGRDDLGFADLDRAVEIAPDSDWIASERGDAYRVAGRYEDAERELSRALSLRPDHASALAGRGNVRYRLGRHTEALADLDRAVELRPAYGWALTHRAVVNRALRRHRESIADADRALELGSQGAWAFEQRARSALAMGRVNSALADLERCAALTDRADRADRADQSGVPLYAAARAHLLAGDPEAALGALDRLTPAFAGGASAGGILLLRCDALRRAGRSAEALAAAEQLRVTNPLRGAFAYALAVTATDGAGAAEPAWRDVAERLAAVDFGAGKRAFWSVTCAAALGEGPLLDASLDTVLAAECGWDELAELTGYLTELTAAPGTSTATDTGTPTATESLAPVLARLTAARDATAARWA